jgi:hypothetical protein
MNIMGISEVFIPRLIFCIDYYLINKLLMFLSPRIRALLELSTIIEDQEVESEILTNAEAPRPYKIPIVHMPHPKDFVGIQNFRPTYGKSSVISHGI